MTGQTVKQTHMTYASTSGVYRGKQGIKKQSGNIQVLSRTFALGETATDFNESWHSSKVQAPIPQRFNWIALYTSLVSQLSMRILVRMFAGSKPLLWHIHPFFYSYSILLQVQLVALPFVIVV